MQKPVVDLKFIKDVGFIGDLSLQDADVLAYHSMNSKSILEFGAGGSTQIFSQCCDGNVISVETSPEWVDKTLINLSKIKKCSEVTFVEYQTDFPMRFDVIFVDGVDHLRADFAEKTWNNLKVGGVMIFHDTRREHDFRNAMQLVFKHFNEISCIEVNAQASDGKSSNMTVICKKDHEGYVDWNQSENKPLWAYGVTDDSVNQQLWRLN